MMLEHVRRSARWIALLMGAAALLVVIASLTPHDEILESEDASCLVCKAGQQPVQHLAPVLVPEPAVARSSAIAREATTEARVVVVDFSSPRAPPA